MSAAGKLTGRGAGASSTEEELATELGEAVRHISRVLRGASMRRLERFGLSEGRFRALRVVARADGAISMSAIADRLGIVPRSATTVIAGLEADGLVERTADRDDRRLVLVRLSTAGAALIAELGRDRDEAAAELFSALGREDQVALLAALRLVVANTEGGASR